MTIRETPRDDSDGDERAPRSERQGRSPAEWTTLLVSLAILLGIAGLVTYLYAVDGNEKPVIVIEPQFAELRQAGDAYYLPVQVTNTGDETAADVRIVGELPTGSGEPETSELEFTFLAGRETADGTMVFSRAPTEAELRILPVSFQDP